MTATASGSITLKRVWISDPNDPNSTPIMAGSSGVLGGGQRDNTLSLDGDFRAYVGRTRLIVRTTTTNTYTIALRWLSYADAIKLETPVQDGGWKGKTLLFRDTYGRKVWGAFLETQRVDYAPANGFCDIQFTITEITHDEAV